MTERFNFTNGPMTTQRAMNNLLAALNIAQGKGVFNLRESAFVYSSLQTLNEFVKKHDDNNNEKNDVVIKDPEPVQQPKPEIKPKPVQEQVQVKQPVQKKKLPDINLENDEPVSEIIEL